MIIAAPILLAVGGVFLGLTFSAFSRHHFLGILALALAATCLTIGALGDTITIPKTPITIHPHSTSSPR